MQSPSTRRAWIEIYRFKAAARYAKVALHPEGVDRNLVLVTRSRTPFLSPSTRRAWIEIVQMLPASKGTRGRPPPGGRG